MDAPVWPLSLCGDWSPTQNQSLRNKLHIYFQSPRRSHGGDCCVELAEGAARGTVSFRSAEVRDRVLAKKDHQIVFGDRSVQLWLSPAAVSASVAAADQSEADADGLADPWFRPDLEVRGSSGSRPVLSCSRFISDATCLQGPEEEEEEKEEEKKVSASDSGSRTEASRREASSASSAAASAAQTEELRSSSVVLDNLPQDMSPDLLSMLVDNVMRPDESRFSMEVIWDAGRAVVSFGGPADAEKFLGASRTNKRMQKFQVTARPLENPTGVRVEDLPSTVTSELLEMFFEKNWTSPETAVMIPDERAAIVTFGDPKVVGWICSKQDYMMASIPVRVYPYYRSLGTALYGEDRATCKMPEPVTEAVPPAVWKFLHRNNLAGTINERMSSFFCTVDMGNPEATLKPVPALLRQRGPAHINVENWKVTALQAFRRQMAEYAAFDCPANAEVWKASSEDVRSVVKTNFILLMDESRGILSVAGRAGCIDGVRAAVENILSQASSRIERQKAGVSEVVALSPAGFYILKLEGLLNVARDISPHLSLSYTEGEQKLTVSGLPHEVYRAKSWILEKKLCLCQRNVDFPKHIQEFLESVDLKEMSRIVFASQDAGIICCEREALVLLGLSEAALEQAEAKMKTVFSHQTFDVDDQEVLRRPDWADLCTDLLDRFNSKNNKTVDVQDQQGTGRRISVAGLRLPVKEVHDSLKDFVMNYSSVEATIPAKSCAVVEFIRKKKDWSGIATDNKVSVRLDSKTAKIVISGPRLHVQQARSCFQEMTQNLSTDALVMDKPGAKKYFKSRGTLILQSLLSDCGCVAVVAPENVEQEESHPEGSGSSHCRVNTKQGLVLSVYKGDICRFAGDAVVNPANEQLQHIGGLALALLRAAGPQLQKLSDDHVAKNGQLRPGDAVITDGFNLPSKYVIHAVGPRFSDEKTSAPILQKTVNASLRQAESARCSSVALPAISAGVFGFPVDLCAAVIARTLREFCDSRGAETTLTSVHLVDNNDHRVRILAAAVDKEFADCKPQRTLPTPDSGGNTGPGGAAGGDRSPGTQDGNATGRLERSTAEGLKILLREGNIQDQKTDAIVNTVPGNMNLSQGFLSSAILKAAGPSLQQEAHAKAQGAKLPSGKVVVTKGFDLPCRWVFHAVCPTWDGGAGRAEEELITITRFCLDEAEKLGLTSLSFPAMGTGRLGFPGHVTLRVLLQEIHRFSRQNAGRLREVIVVVHPSDRKTSELFSRTFLDQKTRVEEPQQSSTPGRPSSPSQKPSASVGQVTSPSPDSYQMQIGQLTFQLLSGDITKETTDAIVNSSNQTFNLRSGVSMAILDAAGPEVLQECANIVTSPGYKGQKAIKTGGGQLPCSSIIHVVGQRDPASIRDIVCSALKVCEENKLSSVSFPALGTGQGGVDPPAVADAMIGAVVDFVRKKNAQSLRTVKFLIFQPAMMAEFHKSMRMREGEQVEQKGVLSRIKDQSGATHLVLQSEKFEPTVLQLCAPDAEALSLAKEMIANVMADEHTVKRIRDRYISRLTQQDLDQITALQKEWTVSMSLESGGDDQEPHIQMEGLAPDVINADSAIREILQRVERAENETMAALMLSKTIQWHYMDHKDSMVPFDLHTNLTLEEAFNRKEKVKIKIEGEDHWTNISIEVAVAVKSSKKVILVRKHLQAALPTHWEDMKNETLKIYPLARGQKEYNGVEAEFRKLGLTSAIISIQRVQNVTLWGSYQLLKKEMEVKNKHQNNERKLFHGTDEASIAFINKEGFNRSYAGRHAAMWGNGTYFAVDPAYSARGYSKPDAQGNKRMYLARVLVGDFTVGKAQLVVPPVKDPLNPTDLFDSVTDNSAVPTMFVVFKDVQAYPEYLITFK